MTINGEIISIILSAGITILAVNLFLVSVFSYRRFRNKKLLFISIVFLLFFIRGILLSVNVLSGMISDQNQFVSLWVFDLFILITLYITSLKR
ncbi:MAG: hypothetical protein V1726_05545 [Methanobacteriota archaeon]